MASDTPKTQQGSSACGSYANRQAIPRTTPPFHIAPSYTDEKKGECQTDREKPDGRNAEEENGNDDVSFETDNQGVKAERVTHDMKKDADKPHEEGGTKAY